MVWTQGAAALPQASVAVHVRRIVSAAAGLVGEQVCDKTSEYVTRGAASHESVAVANPVRVGSIEEPGGSVTFGGHPIVGGVVSLVIDWTQVWAKPGAPIGVTT
jgi:hypothetical protein